MRVPAFARWLTACLARAYPGRRARDRADAFLQEALVDEWMRRRWRGVTALVGVTIRDLARVWTYGAALPVTQRSRARRTHLTRNHRSPHMDRLLADFRYSWRALRRSAAVTIVAIVTLALGIGASTAVYAVADGAILRPFSYPDMPSIVLLMERNRENGDIMSVAWQNFLDWRTRGRDVFRELGIYRGMPLNMTGGEVAERVNAALVSASVFDTTGLPPLRGRAFTAADDERSVSRIAIISERLWQNRFGRSEDVVGTGVVFNNETYTIVGVMPAGMRFPSRTTDVWLPLGLFVDTFPPSRGAHPGLYAVGRLKPGVTLEQATTATDVIARQLEAEYPNTNKNNTITVTSYYEAIVSDIRPAMQLLLGAVGLLLLIACANVAALLLARAEHRQRELAVRAALGAGRGRLIRQLLSEALLLAIAGGVLGTLLAHAVVRWFVATEPSTIPRIDLIAVDWRVVAFATAASLVTALVFGVLPALRASRPDLQHALREQRSTASAGALRLRHALVASQIAIAVVLLVGAGLLTRSLKRVLDIDPGFNPSGVVTGRVALANARYPDADAWIDFFDRAVNRLAAVPGVSAVGINSAVPLEGGAAESPVMKEGDPPPGPNNRPQMCTFQTTGGNYFDAMGIPLRRGRIFDRRDSRESTPVVIVDDSLAAKFFPGQDAVGKRIAFEVHGDPHKDFRPVWREIVGVVGTVKHYGLRATRPFVQVYVPHTQLPVYTRDRRPAMAIAARVEPSRDAENVVAGIRQAIRELDPMVPVYGIQPMTYYVNSATEQPRLASSLLVAFGGVALILAVVGIHGLLSYAVALRTREIGVRMALGARSRDIVRQIMGRGLILTGAGLAAGLGLSLAMSQLLKSQLYQVSPTDTTTYVGVAVLLAVVAITASALPARRASRCDPLSALRTD